MVEFGGVIKRDEKLIIIRCFPDSSVSGGNGGFSGQVTGISYRGRSAALPHIHPA